MSFLNIKRSVSWHENEAWNIRTKNTFLQEVLLSYHKLIIIFWSGFSSLMCQNIGKYFYILTPSNEKMIEEVYITPKSSPLPSDSPLPLCPARMKNYFPVNFVNFLTRGKSRQKWAKKLLKENTVLLCCLLCSLVKKKKAKYSTDTVVFFRNKTFSIRSFVTKRIAWFAVTIAWGTEGVRGATPGLNDNHSTVV